MITDDQIRQAVAADLYKIRQDIAIRKQKIDWNINRLVNLVLSDEDRQLTEDYIMDLRDEVQTLERCFNV